jgi:hypothetical protein
MATTIPAVMALLQASGAVNNCAAWNVLPPRPLTAAQRTTACTAINGGTVATEADALALIATAAVAPVTQKQIWDLMLVNPAANG